MGTLLRTVASPGGSHHIGKRGTRKPFSAQAILYTEPLQHRALWNIYAVCQLYLHRGNSCPQWINNSIRDKIVSFSTVPLKHRVYVALCSKQQVFWCCKGHRCWTDGDREPSTSVTSLPPSGNDGASSALPGQSLHRQKTAERMKSEESEVESRHKVQVQVSFHSLPKFGGKKLAKGPFSVQNPNCFDN